MRKRKEDLFITALRFGKNNLGKGFTEEQLTEHLKSNGYDIRADKNLLEVYLKFVVGFFVHDSHQRKHIHPENYFHLLEHDELQEARQSSRLAMRISIAAIVISVATTISVWFGAKPVEFVDHQIERIERLQFDGSTIESELGTIRSENEKMSKSLQDISDGLNKLAKELETNKGGNP